MEDMKSSNIAIRETPRNMTKQLVSDNKLGRKKSWNICWERRKIPHTSNTRPSCTCVIQEYRFYTRNLGQYHGCCQYHESMFIPWVFVYTMNNNKKNKYRFRNYKNKTCRFIEIWIRLIQKYKMPNWRNTTCRSAEIQMTYLQKYKWLLNYGLLLINGWILNYCWLLKYGWLLNYGCLLNWGYLLNCGRLLNYGWLLYYGWPGRVKI